MPVQYTSGVQTFRTSSLAHNNRWSYAFFKGLFLFVTCLSLECSFGFVANNDEKMTVNIRNICSLRSHSLFQAPRCGGKSFSNKKCEKRAGAGKRQGGSLPFFPPPPPPFPSRARLIFALLVLIRSHYTSTILSESLAQGTVPSAFPSTNGASFQFARGQYGVSPLT